MVLGKVHLATYLLAQGRQKLPLLDRGLQFVHDKIETILQAKNFFLIGLSSLLLPRVPKDFFAFPSPMLIHIHNAFVYAYADISQLHVVAEKLVKNHEKNSFPTNQSL